MSIILKNVSLHIERSVKVGDFKYNKVELGMAADVKDEQPKVIIDKLYDYIDLQVDRLLEADLAKVDSNRRAVADTMKEADEPPFCFETE